MSLINDALKQARRSQQNNPPAGSPPLPPVESASRGGVSWFLLTLIILLLVAAGIFFGLSLLKPAPLPLASTSKRFPPRQIEVVSNSLPAVTNAPSGSNAVPAVPPPPEPKLQGILFDPARPCAIVDGRTVFIGGHVGEFRVTAISKNGVTLKNGTETKVLGLDR